VVVGGQATEVQVAYLSRAQARALANSAMGPDSGLGSNVPEDGDMMTLRDAVDAGVLPWTYDAAKKRLQRRVGRVPNQRGRRDNAYLYSRRELKEWAESNR
jgi:hypothetical protein